MKKQEQKLSLQCNIQFNLLVKKDKDCFYSPNPRIHSKIGCV